MATLTLKRVPEGLVEQLKELAAGQRRSLNQQTILLLERALMEQRPSFAEALGAFYRREGSPDEETARAFDGLRSRDEGREAEL